MIYGFGAVCFVLGFAAGWIVYAMLFDGLN
jgi:hypothetical protein